MLMKYIVVNGDSQDFGEHEVPILFPYITAHKGIADSLYRYRAYRDGMNLTDVVSAGFVRFENNKVTCFGESESLGGVKSRGEVDAKLIEGLEKNFICTRKEK